MIRSLKHDVFEVMCEAGGLGRVVLRTGAHRDVGLDARLFVVDAQVDRQAVVERVDAGFGEVALHGFILVLAFGFFLAAGEQHEQCRGNQQHAL